MEAYVVKDALNSPREAVVEPKPRPDLVPRPEPRPQPVPDAPWKAPQASLLVTNVQHNAYYADRPDLGYFMVFSGTIDIPAGMGQQDQVAVYFHYDLGGGRKGAQVQSLDPSYRDPYGNIVCATALYPIPAQGLRTTWQVWIPYNAFNVPRGQQAWTPQGPVYQQATTNLVAQPVLFVDNFGVAYGQPLLFYVNF
jgi:hypothetical protein